MKNYKLLCILLLFTCSTVFSQVKNDSPDLMSLAKEVILRSKTKENIKQVFWFPLIYWKLSFNDSQYKGNSIIEEIYTTLEDYEIFVVTDVRVSTYSGIIKNDIEDFKLNIAGKDYNPVTVLPERLSMLIGYLKPTFKQMLGQMGESIEVFVFDNHDKTIPSPYEKSEFSVNINSTILTYKLPFPELVMKKTCPKDNEKLNGSWEYCPWHGTKLN